MGPALIAAAAPQQQITSILPLNITGVAVQNGQLVANGLLGNTAFQAPLTLTSSTSSTGTPILHLQINPIHLNLLGLTVDTSKICLDITAQPGPGNLLGNLLSNVAGLLNGGSPLGSILGGLTSTQLGTLTGGLTNLLNGVLGGVNSPSAIAGATNAATGNILHLSLGPVTLNLLGLNVSLDNCAGGPITLDVGAQRGPGNLLGNLLGSLTHLLDTHASQTATNVHLAHLVNAINQLL